MEHCQVCLDVKSDLWQDFDEFNKKTSYKMEEKIDSYIANLVYNISFLLCHFHIL